MSILNASQNVLIPIAVETLAFSPEKESLRVKREKFKKILNEAAQENTPESLIRVVESARPAFALLQFARRELEKFQKNYLMEVVFDPHAHWPAHVWREAGSTKIVIQDSLSFEVKLKNFLFELTNVVQGHKFDGVLQAIAEGAITDKETYAIEMEKVEYEGIKFFSNVMSECIQEEGWPSSMDPYKVNLKGSWKTFQGYLDTQRESNHTQIYEDSFAQILASKSSDT